MFKSILYSINSNDLYYRLIIFVDRKRIRVLADILRSI